MIGMLLGRPKSISQAISMHNSARSAVIWGAGFSNAPWALLLYPALRLFRMQEKRAINALIELEPQHGDEAEEKLLHLMALLAADASALARRDVQRAIDTLYPFRSGLAGTLGRGPCGATNIVSRKPRLTSERSTSLPVGWLGHKT